MGMGVNKSRSDTFIFCVDNRFGGSFTVALADKNYPISCYADICKIGIFLCPDFCSFQRIKNG